MSDNEQTNLDDIPRDSLLQAEKAISKVIHKICHKAWETEVLAKKE